MALILIVQTNLYETLAFYFRIKKITVFISIALNYCGYYRT